MNLISITKFSFHHTYNSPAQLPEGIANRLDNRLATVLDKLLPCSTPLSALLSISLSFLHVPFTVPAAGVVGVATNCYLLCVRVCVCVTNTSLD